MLLYQTGGVSGVYPGQIVCPKEVKRPDEKFVTEKMYENPRFVEDVVREVSLRINQLNNIKHYTIKASADESIHMHQAYAIKRK